MAHRRIVIIGAGVVGAALADELVLRGELDVTVIDKGPLFATGGSSSHAPGLISRTSTSRFMTETADATVRKFATLSTGEGPALLPVGTLEVAYTEERLAELWRRWGAALAFGWHGRMIGPDEAIGMWPTIERDGLLGAYTTDGEGLAAALRAVEAQAGRAAEGGARFVGDTAISEIITDRGAVRGVRTTTGDTIDADVIVCCAGVWGPALAETVGLTLPMLPTEHQYAITSPIAELADAAGREATRPIIRHHDIGIYYRDHGDRVGVGSFHHQVLPVPSAALDVHARNEHRSLAFGFTPEDFAEAWELTCAFMPALSGARFERRFNGVFGFTPDGYPLIGEHPGLRGFWVAESVWVTHSAGVAQIVADLLCDRDPAIDATPADLGRFDEPELEPSFFEARSSDQYTDVYLAHHPAEPHVSARDAAVQPCRRASACARRGVRRRRHLGAAAVVRGERATRQRRAQARHLVGAALVADRGRGAPGGPRARGPVRHDAADTDRGARVGRAGPAPSRGRRSRRRTSRRRDLLGDARHTRRDRFGRDRGALRRRAVRARRELAARPRVAPSSRGR